jgi:hypothetical protein
MVAIAMDFSGIVGMADTSSYFVKERLVAFYTITPQMLQHMSQGHGDIHVCIQHQGAHTDPLDI